MDYLQVMSKSKQRRKKNSKVKHETKDNLSVNKYTTSFQNIIYDSFQWVLDRKQMHHNQSCPKEIK